MSDWARPGVRCHTEQDHVISEKRMFGAAAAPAAVAAVVVSLIVSALGVGRMRDVTLMAYQSPDR